MGNCQAVDAAALVIQHPSGKIERFYWPLIASEIMRNNPGYYVSLIIPLPVTEEQKQEQKQEQKSVVFTRVKLLKPNETLTLGHAYRLITTQDVEKVLRAKKHGKTVEKKETVEKPSSASEIGGKLEKGRKDQLQGMEAERHRQRAAPVNPNGLRSKSWRPSLQSISESGI